MGCTLAPGTTPAMHTRTGTTIAIGATKNGSRKASSPVARPVKQLQRGVARHRSLHLLRAWQDLAMGRRGLQHLVSERTLDPPP